MVWILLIAIFMEITRILAVRVPLSLILVAPLKNLALKTPTLQVQIIQTQVGLGVRIILKIPVLVIQNLA